MAWPATKGGGCESENRIRGIFLAHRLHREKTTRKLKIMLGKTATATTSASGKVFPGQYYDQETGCHYNYFRTYCPDTGRYLTADPIGLRGGLNTYGYAYQNPVNYYDPNGLAIQGLAGRLGVAALDRVLLRRIGITSTTLLLDAILPDYDPNAYNEGGEKDSDFWDGLPNPDDYFGDKLGAESIPDPGGSGNSDRAKKCREICGNKHLGTGPGSASRYRRCLRDCMANPNFCP